eukprot:820027-Alexandrium_andersonii.AAC.1
MATQFAAMLRNLSRAKCGHLVPDIVVHQSAWPRVVVACKLCAERLRQEARKAADSARSQARKKLGEQLVSPGSTRAFTLLRPPNPK